MMYVILIIYLVVVFVLFANGKELEHIYDRKLPKESSAVCMYYYNSKFNGKEFWVTLLELIDRDFYKLENINGTRYLIWSKGNMFELDNLGLKPFEKKVVSFVNSLIYGEKRENKMEFELFKAQIKVSPNLSKGMETYYTLLKDEIINTYGLISHDNKHMKVFLINFIYMIIVMCFTLKISFMTIVLSIILSSIATFVANMLANTKSIFKAIVTVILLIFMPIVIIILFLMSFGLLEFTLFMISYSEFNIGTVLLFLLHSLYPLLIIVDILLLKNIKNIKNIEQQRLIDNLLGLRNFMIEFTNTNQRPIDYINFLDKYYVLAVALNVNLKYPDYIKGIYDDDTIHTFDCDDMMKELEDMTAFMPMSSQIIRR